MTTVVELHNAAMSSADKADAAARAGDAVRATRAYRRAYKMELDAIELLRVRKGVVEPSWSVMHASAATFAIRAGLYREAERLLCTAIAGDPTDDILDDLRNLLDDAQYRRHLDLRGVDLSATQFQMSLDGAAVGHGFASAEVSTRRIETTTRLIERTAERQAGVTFRIAGGVVSPVRAIIAVEVSPPRAASYALTFSVARRNKQLSLFPDLRTLDPVGVVDEFFECMRLFDAEQLDELRKRIGDDDYFNNFVALARVVAPDGTNVKTVGFTRRGGDNDNDRVAMRRPTRRSSGRGGRVAKDLREIVGVLDVVNGRSAFKAKDGDGTISILDDQKNVHRVYAPRALVADLVVANYGKRITALVKRVGDRDHLEAIEPAPDSL